MNVVFLLFGGVRRRPAAAAPGAGRLVRAGGAEPGRGGRPGPHRDARPSRCCSPCPRSTGWSSAFALPAAAALIAADGPGRPAPQANAHQPARHQRGDDPRRRPRRRRWSPRSAPAGASPWTRRPSRLGGGRCFGLVRVPDQCAASGAAGAPACCATCVPAGWSSPPAPGSGWWCSAFCFINMASSAAMQRARAGRGRRHHRPPAVGRRARRRRPLGMVVGALVAMRVRVRRLLLFGVRLLPPARRCSCSRSASRPQLGAAAAGARS